MSQNLMDRFGSNRRRIIKSLLGFGVSIGTINALTKQADGNIPSDLREEVPFVFAREKDGKIIRTIPRKKWVHVEAAHQIANQLRRELESKFSQTPSKYISVGVKTDKTLHHSGKAIEVDINKVSNPSRQSDSANWRTSGQNITEENVRRIVPDSADGKPPQSRIIELFGNDDSRFAWEIKNIPIVINSNEVVLECGDYFNQGPRPLPGGMRMQKMNGGGYGTVGMKAKDGNGSDVMVSAGHAVSAGDWGQPNNNTTALYDNNWKTSGSDDIGIFTPAGSVSLAEGVGGTYQSYDAAGILTRNSLKYYEGDQSFVVHKQGRTTEIQSGHIYKTSQGGDLVHLNAKSEAGDSGGPYYHVVEGPDKIYWVGIHAYGDGSDYCKGTHCSGNSAAAAEDILNISIVY